MNNRDGETDEDGSMQVERHKEIISTTEDQTCNFINKKASLDVAATTDTGSNTITLSALSYAHLMISAYTDSKYQNAAAAIYSYYEAAQAYKDRH